MEYSVRFDDNTWLEIYPWQSKGYLFKSMNLTEQIGDNIARGEVILTTDGTDLDPIINEDSIEIYYTQHITNSKPVHYDIKGFIYSKKLMENELYLYFIAAPDKNFSTKSLVREFKEKTLDQVIDEIYPGYICKLDNPSIESDVKGPLNKLDQNGLTNLDLCYRLCRSYKKGSMYSLGLEGLILFNLENSNQIPYEIDGESDSAYLEPPKFGYYKEMEQESLSRDSSVNIQPRMYGTKYILTKKDFHSELADIYQYNTRFLTDMKSRVRLRFISRFPEFKIGNLVRFKNKHNFNKNRNYVVSWINIDIKLHKITFDCELNSWEDTCIG